ncbi:MAG: hypothetical protein VKJ04_03275 [Vampirovibrionales bacterium]|nr:hypothetical protein [Vampirovibrionales bacterium]
MQKTPQAVACSAHPHNTTRLRCSHCETPICPQCMIQTEVGFKCPGCIKSQSSHLFQASPAQFAIALLLSGVIGFGYGLLHPYMFALPFTIMGVPLLGLILSFFLGTALGKGLLKLLRYKRHPMLRLLASVGFFVGLILGPYQRIILTPLMLMLSGLLGAENGNLFSSGTSSIFMWVNIAANLLLPLLLYRGIMSTLKNPG